MIGLRRSCDHGDRYESMPHEVGCEVTESRSHWLALLPALQRQTGAAVIVDNDSLAAAAGDTGRIVRRDPIAVVAPSDAEESLAPHRNLGWDDAAVAEHMNRYQPRFDLMRRSGAWQQAHPWLDLLLPWLGRSCPTCCQRYSTCSRRRSRMATGCSSSTHRTPRDSWLDLPVASSEYSPSSPWECRVRSSRKYARRGKARVRHDRSHLR